MIRFLEKIRVCQFVFFILEAMSYNQSSVQKAYVNTGGFGTRSAMPFDEQLLQQPQQQQIPISPPPFHSPIAYETPVSQSSVGSHSSSSSSSTASSCGTSVEFETLRFKNNMCKSFEDDLFYCPRSLLSAQEQLTCEKMDIFMAEQMRDVQNLQQQSSSPSLSFARPKFNPYTSQSFSPAPNG